jgi:hypothetical protein
MERSVQVKIPSVLVSVGIQVYAGIAMARKNLPNMAAVGTLAEQSERIRIIRI